MTDLPLAAAPFADEECVRCGVLLSANRVSRIPLCANCNASGPALDWGSFHTAAAELSPEQRRRLLEARSSP